MKTTVLATCPPRRSAALSASQIFRRNAFAWLDIYQTSAALGLSYWTSAAARGATPYKLAADGLRWLQIVGSRRAPTWSTPNRVVSSSNIMALRDFSDGSATEAAPSLILPPQAGHHSCIVDYSPAQSQVLTARAAGLTRLYVLEWLGATPETKDTSIGDYIESVREAIAHIGGPVNLIGDCQGGWLATLYAAMHPQDVATLTIGGAPIDFQAGDAPIADSVQLIGAARGLEPYRLAVELAGGILRGELLLGGFIALQPQTEVKKHLELFLHLDDDEFVQRYAEFQDWYTFTQDLPGAMYLWAVEHLFFGNELVCGTLEIEGQPVSLGSITCPLNLLAGTDDHITPPDQVFALADHVGTSPNEITKLLTTGGHLGLFMGRHALKNAWLPLLQGVAAHTG